MFFIDNDLVKFEKVDIRQEQFGDDRNFTVITQVVGIIAAFWQQNHDAILATVQNAWTGIYGVVQQILPAVQIIVQTVFGFMTTFLQQHGAEIVSVLTLAWQTIDTIVQFAVLVLQQAVVPAFQQIAAFLQAHGAEIQAIISIAWTAVSGVIRVALDVIIGVLQVAMALMQGNQQAAWTAIQAMVGRVWNDIQGIIKGAWDALNTATRGKLQELANTIQAKMDEIHAFMQTFPGKLVQIGRDMIQGLIDGIREKADQVSSTLQDIVNGAVNAAKNALGIHSPSVVFAAIGEQTMAGLAQGIRLSASNVYGAVQDVAQGMYDAYRKYQDEIRLEDAFTIPRFNKVPTADRLLAVQRERYQTELAILAAQAKAAETDPWAAMYVNYERIAELKQNMLKLDQEEASLKQAQTEIELLKQQFDLMMLIKEQHLNAKDLLKGVQFGVTGDLTGIIDATRRAMQILVGNVKKDLGIASPSKVFMDIGHQLMAGLAAGITDGVGTVSMAGGLAGQAAAASVQNNFYLTANYPYQDQRSLADDVRMLQLLGAGV